MATSLASDFKVYNPQFQAGLWEGITQAVNAFNAASGNAIRLNTESMEGDYKKEAIFTNVANLITRRDITSVTAVEALKLGQDELISVKVDRKIGPVEFALSAIRRIGKTPEEASFVLGQMVGQKKAQDMLNTGILAVEAAIEGQTLANFDATGETSKVLSALYLVKGMAILGDMSERIAAWVMHSKAYFDLVQGQISDKVTNIADRIVYGGTPATMGRPVVISDIPALHDANGSATDTYNVLGLVQGAVEVTESEQSEIVTQIITGGENIVARVQGEYAMNIGCKGFKWDTTNGGVSPTDAALGTTTNWDKVMASVKDCAGIRIKVQ